MALPDGLSDVGSVARGNGLAACTCLYVLVLALLRNTYLVEQPNSSVLFETSRMQWLVATFSDLGYPVWVQSFWMRGWGHEYPKRTKVWSNSPAVRVFATDKLAKQTVKNPPTCKRYESKSGKKGYTATKQLKKTEQLGLITWLKFQLRHYPAKFAAKVVETLPSFAHIMCNVEAPDKAFLCMLF